jgi:outer membrane protein assembly factor BamB
VKKYVSAISLFAAAAFLILGAGINAADAAAECNWPQWRGPNRDDVSSVTGLLKAWPPGGPPLLWKAAGTGTGFSSVSVVGERIYTMGDINDSSYVLALNLKDGSPVWKAKVGKPAGGGGYPGTRCTPSVDGSHVYALGQFGDLVCVQAADGKEVWRKDMVKDFAGKMMSGWGYSESPLVDGALLVCTPGGLKGTMAALDKTTGALKWRCMEITDNAAYSSIVPADIGGVHQFIQMTDRSVFGVDAQSGKLLWKAPRKGSTAVIPTPIYYDNHVFVTSGYGIGCNCFKITANNGSFSAAQVYDSKEMINHHGGVVRVGDYVYGHSENGGWTCMELKTGAVKWKERGVGKGSVTCADGHLYMRHEGGPGTIALAEVSPEAYKETGRFDQPGRSDKNSWPHPVVCCGKLFIRDQNILLCYDVKAK